MSNYNQSYGQSYGQNYSQDQGAYAQQHGQPNQPGGSAANYYNQPMDQSQQHPYGQQSYPSGQGASSNGAVGPDGERGLGTNLMGAAAGGLLGHKLGGHGMLGALAGGIGAHILGKQQHKPSHGHHNGYSHGGKPQSGLGGMMHQLTGKRELDSTTGAHGSNASYGGGSGYDSSQQSYGGQPSSYGQQQYQPPQTYGQAPQNPNQTYGSGYGQ